MTAKPWALVSSRCGCGALVESLVYSKRHKAATARAHADAEREHRRKCGKPIARFLLNPDTREPLEADS